MLNRGANRIRGEFASPGNTERLAELHFAFHLEAIIIGSTLAVFVNRQVVVLDLSRRRLEDEVEEMAVIDASLNVDGSSRTVDAELGAVAFLQVEVRVADQELFASAM